MVIWLTRHPPFFAALAKDFLKNFADANGELKYLNLLQDVANRRTRAVQIELDDLFNYKDLDEEFLERVTENTRRYVSIFAEAVDELLPEPTELFSAEDDHDILMTQRAEDLTENADNSDPFGEDATGNQKIFYEG
ncbi:hypothetical protein HPP92_010930 [Vanilla planifolia]|uniref:MCM N-terminal domain-containing protein n=1 Tax=Vanilla planifolia TaxID=51239 RepID=A0A835R652_VANPL|nr:hypothetical protein HPP92_010930 [Vanilla planifolia]